MAEKCDLCLWNQGSGGGGGGGGSSVPDVVIEATGDDAWSLSVVSTYTLVSGTYAALKAKLIAHEPVNVLLFCHSSDSGRDAYGVFTAISAVVETENDGATDWAIGLMFVTFNNSGTFMELYFFPDGRVSDNPGD